MNRDPMKLCVRVHAVLAKEPAELDVSAAVERWKASSDFLQAEQSVRAQRFKAFVKYFENHAVPAARVGASVYYRGMEPDAALLAAIRVGVSLELRKFTSWTTSAEVAEHFGHLTIEVASRGLPGTCPLLDLQDMEDDLEEHEVVFPPGILQPISIERSVDEGINVVHVNCSFRPYRPSELHRMWDLYEVLKTGDGTAFRMATNWRAPVQWVPEPELKKKQSKAPKLGVQAKSAKRKRSRKRCRKLKVEAWVKLPRARFTAVWRVPLCGPPAR